MIGALVRRLLDAGARRAPAHQTLAPLTRRERLDEEQAQAQDQAQDQAQVQPAVWRLETIARALGLQLEEDHLLRREALTWELPEPLREVDLSDWRARAQVSAALQGARLGLDTLQAGYHAGLERPSAPAQVFRKEDIPPPHGERLPRLIPRASLEVISALLGHAPLHEPFDEDQVVIFALEVGRWLHVMREQDAEAAGLSRERVISDAREALFYESYKVRPSHITRGRGFQVKHLRTVEGLGNTRLLLMPELDHDATRARGACVAPTRELLLICEPDAPEHRSAAYAALAEDAEAARAASAHPLRAAIYALREGEPLRPLEPQA